MNKAKKYMILGILLLLMSLVGSLGTYAWFTWKSTNNTSLTMTIGKLADVIFTSGNSISTSTLSPVYNYTDGEVTTFSINNKDTTGTTVDYAVKLNITSIATELKNTSLKYVLLKNNIIVQEGDISSSYLYNDGVWWTMTPVGFTHLDNTEPFCMLYKSSMSELNTEPVEYEWGIHPVISLKSSVIISGDGTINNPFTVD